MDLYKVMLVDDEPEVIEAVIRKMDWEGLGFEVIGYAQNGEEALEMAEGNVPDVVMTDIKMPFMDGLTLSKKLKESYDGIKVIIFSGFDEFEYAREAIKLEVEEYILKPIKLEELTEIFRRMKEALDRERDEKLNLHMLKEYYQKSLPVMQDQFYIGLLEGRIDKEQIDSFRKNYQIELEAPFYTVAVIQFQMAAEAAGTMEKELMQFSMKRLADENLEGLYQFKSFLYFEQIVYITMLSDKSQIKEYTDLMDRICKTANRILKMNAAAGIGCVCESLDALCDSYTGAKNAVFYGEGRGSNQAVYIDYIQPQSSDTTDWSDKEISSIIREIRVGDKESLGVKIEEFIVHLKEAQMPVPQFKIILMELVTEMYKMTCAYPIDATEIFGDDMDVYRIVNHFTTMEDLKQWLLESCLKLRKSASRERSNSAKILVDKAVAYLEENYSDSELSVEKLCGVLNVSAAYFCTIFKKETGKTFLNYLTDLRMEKAIRLLEETEEKSYVISEMVGYAEPNYFSYVFKKKYGMAPSKYRKTRME